LAPTVSQLSLDDQSDMNGLIETRFLTHLFHLLSFDSRHNMALCWFHNLRNNTTLALLFAETQRTSRKAVGRRTNRDRTILRQ